MAAPRKHPPANAISEIERLAAMGYSIIGIAKALGVSKETFKCWCEENGALQEAFEVGRETERQALHSLLVQSAVANKPANVNAIFLLKARHGYREFDSPHTKVDVAVTVAPVMVVRDHGSDQEWQAKATAQQRALTLNAAEIPPASVVPTNETLSLRATVAPAHYGPPFFDGETTHVPGPVNVLEAAPRVPVAPPAPAYPVPRWSRNA